MGAFCCNIGPLHVFAMCLLLVLQTGTRVVYVEAQSTNSYDVIGTNYFVLSYPQLDETVDDPCYPVKYSWVGCSFQNGEYRVTALYLGSRSLVYQLADFSSMDALEIIDLHDNSFSGHIPYFLGTIPSLKTLNLADNRFTGSVPSSLANNKNLEVDFSDNPGLDTSNYRPSGKKQNSKLPIILGIVGAALLISAVVGVIAVHKQKLRTEAAISAAATSAQSSGIGAYNGAPTA